ncbi:MAG: A/G-specific adenine glycosylase [Anaerolineae bacterium]|nr:A/G-specific adenine glycosylase [Anaerolineae bacterium]
MSDTEFSTDQTDKTEQLRARLLDWFYRDRRNLPWRGEISPYRVWISEVMLQQTQVVTVIPYYERFLEAFPTLTDLALASLDDVLKVWEGLGYYARARNLHNAARKMVEKWDGDLPDNYVDLLSLPGFGHYTAGAVASIAFGEVVPAVDGNVKRVIARLFAIESSVKQGEGAVQVQNIATELVDPQQPGDWTETLIEFGALICLPRSPRCPDCPVQDLCQARQRGLENTLPVRASKKPLPHYDVTAAVIRRPDDDERLLIAQRPLDGMLGGLWEFPGGKRQLDESLPECLRREIREELGVEIEVGEPLVTVKHSYTHFKITLYAYHCRLVSGDPQALQVADWRWVTLAELDTYAFPRTDEKIIKALHQ